MSNSPKIVLITGGSRGLGRDAALKLAQHGRDVILTYRSQREEAQAVVEQIQAAGRRAVALPLDVGNNASFTSFAEQLSASLREIWQREDFDFLINNAGIGVHAPYAETSEAQFDQMVNIHLKGPFS